eukprot:6527376-Prymnesium_polylepis.1
MKRAALLWHDAKARALQVTPKFFAASVIVSVWTLACEDAPDERSCGGTLDELPCTSSLVTTRTMCVMCVIQLSSLATLSDAPREDAIPGTLVPYRLCQAIPAMEVVGLLRRLGTTTCGDERAALFVAMGVHGLNLVMLLVGLVALQRGLVTFWWGFRAYLAAIGSSTLTGTFMALHIGCSEYPAPGGTATLTVSLTTCGWTFALAAATRPLFRRRALELWTVVPLSALCAITEPFQPSRRAQRSEEDPTGISESDFTGEFESDYTDDAAMSCGSTILFEDQAGDDLGWPRAQSPPAQE